jgi:hypothetical protein
METYRGNKNLLQRDSGMNLEEAIADPRNIVKRQAWHYARAMDAEGWHAYKEGGLSWRISKRKRAAMNALDRMAYDWQIVGRKQHAEDRYAAIS